MGKENYLKREVWFRKILLIDGKLYFYFVREMLIFSVKKGERFDVILIFISRNLEIE